MDALHEIRSTVVSTLKLLRLVPLAIASIIVSGWGFRFLAQPKLWLALMVSLVVGGSLFHKLARSAGTREGTGLGP